MYVSRAAFVAALLLTWAGVSCTEARPPPIAQSPLTAGKVEEVSCENIEKYTTEWFLANTKPEFSGNLKKTALFYSRGMSTVARHMAKANGLTTIWDVWPCYLYNHHTTPTNPLRCVHADSKQQLRFFENMSRAFAIKTQNFGTVLHSTADFPKPPTDGIWARVEFPALKRGCVQSLEKINENRSMAHIFWKCLEVDVTGRRPSWNDLEQVWEGVVQSTPGWAKNIPQKLFKRKTPDYGYCLSDKELEAFDKIDW